MPLELTRETAAFVTPILAAVSMVAAILVVGWPYVAPDPQAQRLRLIRDERERIRTRERARLNAGSGSGLVVRPQRFFSEIVRRLRLDPMTEDGGLAQMMRRAGYRGRRPVYAYVAMQVIAPVVFLAAAALYLYGLGGGPEGPAMKLGILLGAAAAGYLAPRIYVRNRIDRRRQGILKAWPDALDLMLICVEAGMTIETAIGRVADEIAGQSIELAEELHLTVAELSYLLDRKLAYDGLGDRTDLHSVRAVVKALVQSERYGTSIGQTLRVLAREERGRRMMEAERKAAALPPKLTVPMILFFLPVLFIVILMPAVIQVMNME